MRFSCPHGSASLAGLCLLVCLSVCLSVCQSAGRSAGSRVPPPRPSSAARQPLPRGTSPALAANKHRPGETLGRPFCSAPRPRWAWAARARARCLPARSPHLPCPTRKCPSMWAAPSGARGLRLPHAARRGANRWRSGIGPWCLVTGPPRWLAKPCLVAAGLGWTLRRGNEGGGAPRSNSNSNLRRLFFPPRREGESPASSRNIQSGVQMQLINLLLPPILHCRYAHAEVRSEIIFEPLHRINCTMDSSSAL
ncbi:hypothetical protein DFH27DRAFT_119084 [Peziza echinospora]|nr:hypothetical protein DFH27DRAFT_119084 [Peziza echinospora]